MRLSDSDFGHCTGCEDAPEECDVTKLKAAFNVDLPLPTPNTVEAEAVLLAVLVDRLGGTVTVTEAELHAMRDSRRYFTAARNPTAFEWTLELLSDPTAGA
jgi:hypothetical protein